MVFWNKDVLFCELHPVCYKISAEKEVLKRHLADRGRQFAQKTSSQQLSNVISCNQSHLIKTGRGIDPVLQYNKAENIAIAAATINQIVIEPGEEFSFWKRVGRITKRKGYKDGRVILGGEIKPGRGGGLCNLANSLNLLILHSPLELTELHTHSDALAPDKGARVPFATGTSVAYNMQDLRFTNTTNQSFQLCVWCDEHLLYAELRSEEPIDTIHRLEEEDHHFRKEGEDYYRVSKIYRETLSKDSGELLARELILDNHSKVMYDHDLIPVDQIRS